eukprot:7430947-Ditylum_brightwellii.AAC.1
MCTSYGNVTIEHACNSRTTHITPYRILPDPSPQLLCNMCHEDCYHPAKGILRKCTNCQLEFTIQDIVNNELNRWNNMDTGGNHASIIFPLQ